MISEPFLMSRELTQVLVNSQFSARPEGTLSQSEATERILNYILMRASEYLIALVNNVSVVVESLKD